MIVRGCVAIVCCALCVCFSVSFAQDVSNMTKKDMFKVNGNVSATTVFYNMDGAPSRRDPFYWVINASVNTRVAGVDLPFSATFSQQNSDFGQPFNQFGVSPSYKGYTAHLGWRSMNFSTYTYGGNIFLGVGAEAKRKKSKVEAQAMYGRLIKPIDPFEFAAKNGNLDPAFERWGYGASVKLKPKFGDVNFSLFRAKDDVTSISADSAIAYGITPAENLVYGVHGKANVTKRTKFKYEIAQSIYTEDNSQEAVAIQSFTWADNLGALVKANSSTKIDEAISLGLSHKFGNSLTANVNFKQVDPGYRTMGSPFLNNDQRHITGGFQSTLFKNKVSVGVNLGVQNDNLDETKKDRMSRTAFSSNLAWKATKKMNITLNYSNFSSNTYKVKVIAIDSLSYFNVTRNLNTAISYVISQGTWTQMLVLVGGYQDLKDAQSSGSRMYTTNANYQLTHKPTKISARLSVNYFQNVVDPIKTSGVGPMVSLSRPFFKQKLNVSVTSNYLSNYQNDKKLSAVFNNSLNVSTSIKKKHTLNGAMNIVSNRTNPTNSFNEYRATITYAYAF